MIAPQNHEPGIGEVMKNSQEQWYASVDECLLVSEVHPASYEYAVATGYGNVPPINEGGMTSLDILAHRFHVVSVENSCILINQEVEVTIPKSDDSYAKFYYIGYLTSFACIGSYMIDTNTDQLMTVSHANWEALINYISTKDDVKESDPNYATLAKIRRKDPFVPGTYVDVSKITGDTKITVPITLKIPLTYFLLFHNIKYLPEWMGKFIIKITPSYRNIVVAPVIPEEAFIIYPDIVNKMNLENAQDSEDQLVDFGFYQLNQKMRNKFTLQNDGTCTLGAVHEFKCIFQRVTKCEMRLATYQLNMDVFNRLAFQYAQVPFIFPINMVYHKDFAMPIDANENINTTLTAALMYVDSSYTFFKEDGIKEAGKRGDQREKPPIKINFSKKNF